MSSFQPENISRAYVTPAQYESIRSHSRSREVVFGEDYIQEMIDQPASRRTTDEFIGTVAALTERHPLAIREDALLLPGKNAEHKIRIYAPGALSRGNTNLDTRVAAAEHVSDQTRFTKPRNYPLGWYNERDSVYVELSFRRVRVVRERIGGLVLGRRFTLRAEAEASEPLLKRALDSIWEANLRNIEQQPNY